MIIFHDIFIVKFYGAEKYVLFKSRGESPYLNLKSFWSLNFIQRIVHSCKRILWSLSLSYYLTTLLLCIYCLSGGAGLAGLAQGHYVDATLAPCVVTESQLFSCLAWPNSVNKYFFKNAYILFELTCKWGMIINVTRRLNNNKRGFKRKT